MLLQPAVSVGNVGQLAVDLILANVKDNKDGVFNFYHPGLLPVVGADPFDSKSDSIMTAGQMTILSEAKVVVAQIRSGLVKGKRDEFLDDVLAWAKSVGIAKIILLTSSEADERLDCQIQVGNNFRFICSSTEKSEEFK